MTTFQQRLREEMVRRNYSPSTIRTYVHVLRTCERYHHPRRLDRLRRDALRRYHASLFQEQSSPSARWGSTWPRCGSSSSAC